MANPHTLKVLVQDTENIIFSGDVERVTSYNEMGKFDIYPMHANFISIVTKGLELYHNKQKIKEMPLEQAVMKVKKDEVHIYLGIEMLLVDDDPEQKQPAPTKKK